VSWQVGEPPVLLFLTITRGSYICQPIVEIGEEVEVETEVEVHEKPKKLFLFAPKVVPMH
jgi:hypothetical protein